MKFAQLVSEIDISKYEQKEYVQIVKAIYWEIFYSLNTEETKAHIETDLEYAKRIQEIK